MNDSVETRLARLERAVRMLADRLEKSLERRTIRKLSNKPGFKGRVLDWVNENAVGRDVSAEAVAKALSTDHDATARALFRLAHEGFVERVKHGYYRAFEDDSPVDNIDKEPN